MGGPALQRFLDPSADPTGPFVLGIPINVSPFVSIVEYQWQTHLSAESRSDQHRGEWRTTRHDGIVWRAAQQLQTGPHRRGSPQDLRIRLQQRIGKASNTVSSDAAG